MWFLIVFLVIVPLGMFKGSWFLTQLMILSWIFPHLFGWLMAILLLPIVAFEREDAPTPPLWVRAYGAIFFLVDKYLFLFWPALAIAVTRAHAHEVGAWLAWPLVFVIAQTPVGIMMGQEPDRGAASRAFAISFVGFFVLAFVPSLSRAMYGWMGSIFQ